MVTLLINGDFKQIVTLGEGQYMLDIMAQYIEHLPLISYSYDIYMEAVLPNG